MSERNFDEAAQAMATGPAPVTNGNDVPVLTGEFDEDTLAALGATTGE